MLICLNDLFACSGLTQTCKLLTNFSKNSFYLLPEPLRLGEFLTNYCENGNPFIDNMDDMETLADKMELKWLNPETSKYVECDYFDLKWGYMEDGHYYFSVNSTDVIGDGDDRTASFSFDLVCEDIFSEPVNIKTEWITSLPTYKLYYPLDKIYVNDVKAEVTNIDRGTITVPSVQTIYIPLVSR